LGGHSSVCPETYGRAATRERCHRGRIRRNLANYLWDGRRVRIVDLEDARISDPATELANLVEHLSARSVNTEALSRRFDSDPARFLAARRVWAMFWLRLLLPGGSSEGRNPPGTCDAQARRLMSLLDGV
jgi:hypothetical protein